MKIKNELEKKNELEPTTLSINKLLNYIFNQKLLVPVIQRDLVWKDDKKVKFLKTLEKKYPYGAIILGKDFEEKTGYFIVDGLQRTTTILEIFRNCYKYADEYKEEIFQHFLEIFKVEILDDEQVDVNQILKQIKENFEENFNTWKKENVIDYNEFAINCYHDGLAKWSRKFDKSFRETYDWFKTKKLVFMIIM